MSRVFDGIDDAVTFAGGGIAGIHTGAQTYVYLIKIGSSHRGGLFDGRNSGGTRRMGINPFDSGSGTIFLNIAGQGGPSFDYGPIIGHWAIVAITKAAGSAVFRIHIYDYTTGLWSHVDTGSPTGNGSDAITALFIGSFDSGQFLNAKLAVAGFWAGVVLADLQLEGLTTALLDWVALTPSALLDFHGLVATPIVDLMSSGTDQTAIVGTTRDTGDDPPGFDYSLAPPSEGAAAFTLDLSPAGVGGRSSSGVAAFNLNLVLAAASHNPSDVTPAGIYRRREPAVVSRAGTLVYRRN